MSITRLKIPFDGEYIVQGDTVSKTSFEFVGVNDNVRLRGVRDVDNRYFINDRNSVVALLFRSANEAISFNRRSR